MFCAWNWGSSHHKYAWMIYRSVVVLSMYTVLVSPLGLFLVQMIPRKWRIDVHLVACPVNRRIFIFKLECLSLNREWFLCCEGISAAILTSELISKLRVPLGQSVGKPHMTLWVTLRKPSANPLVCFILLCTELPLHPICYTCVFHMPNMWRDLIYERISNLND